MTDLPIIGGKILIDLRIDPSLASQIKEWTPHKTNLKEYKTIKTNKLETRLIEITFKTNRDDLRPSNGEDNSNQEEDNSNRVEDLNNKQDKTLSNNKPNKIVDKISKIDDKTQGKAQVVDRIVVSRAHAVPISECSMRP